MSKLSETQKAYDRITDLLGRAILTNRGSVNELRKAQDVLDVAFYLLAWGQFEYLVKNEVKDRVSGGARAKGLLGFPWRLLNQNIRQMTISQMLELIFIADQQTLEKLQKDYGVRNASTHDYRMLPTPKVRVSEWIAELEDHVQKFSV